MATITYYELSNYNNGSLIFKTFDLDGVTYEEHHQEITCWLEELTEQTGELCEEWIVADYEEVPSNFVGEWSIDEAFFEYAEALEGSCFGVEVFEAAAELGIPVDKIEDAYHGEFESDEEMAEEYCESTGMLADMAESLRCYFDMERFGRDLAMDFSEFNGHYFNSSY
jgi:antirestriction protein